jgi:hypothetical protein
MSRNLREVYLKDIRFLIGLKKSVGMLNNRIHDNLALVAIDHFEQKYPDWFFYYTNAGASGIDVVGKNKEGAVTLVAEVKTTLTDHKGYLRGPQQKSLKKDLERLSAYTGNVERYLVLLSKATKDAVEKQFRASDIFPTVSLFNALNESVTEENEEEA